MPRRYRQGEGLGSDESGIITLVLFFLHHIFLGYCHPHAELGGNYLTLDRRARVVAGSLPMKTRGRVISAEVEQAPPAARGSALGAHRRQLLACNIGYHLHMRV